MAWQPYYEYVISLETFEPKENPPYIRRYTRKCKRALSVCLEGGRSQNTMAKINKFVDEGAHIVIWKKRGSNHVIKAWMLIMKSGIIERFGYSKGVGKKRVLPMFLALLYGCLNYAWELGLPAIKLRIPISNYKLNMLMQELGPQLDLVRVSSRYIGYMTKQAGIKGFR